jgi:hypothetical protein
MTNTEQNPNNEILSQRIGERIVFQEVQKQQNIDTVIYIAYKELENEPPVPDEPVDKDWAFRFFQYAANVCDSDIQKIWGKILADKVKHPKNCSLRTLEVLKNISKKEAELFTKISTLVIQNGAHYFIPSEESLYEKYNITFNDFFNVKEYGLIEVVPMIVLPFTIQKNKQNALHNRQIAGIFSTNENTINMQLPQFPLTEAGRQLYKILNLRTNKDFALDYFKVLKDKHKTINVTAHKFTKIHYDANLKTSIIEYDDEDLLTT